MQDYDAKTPSKIYKFGTQGFWKQVLILRCTLQINCGTCHHATPLADVFFLLFNYSNFTKSSQNMTFRKLQYPDMFYLKAVYNIFLIVVNFVGQCIESIIQL